MTCAEFLIIQKMLDARDLHGHLERRIREEVENGSLQEAASLYQATHTSAQVLWKLEQALENLRKGGE